MIHFGGVQNYDIRAERSKVGGGGVQDVVLDLGVRGLGQVSLWKKGEAGVRLISPT